MTGNVDQAGRALLGLELKNPVSTESRELELWIDTAFDGDIALPRDLIQALGLVPAARVLAILADGSEAELVTFTAEINWFGERRRVEIVAKNGKTPLLGVALMLGHKLTIDYKSFKLKLV